MGQNQWYHFGVGAPPILEPDFDPMPVVDCFKCFDGLGHPSRPPALMRRRGRLLRRQPQVIWRWLRRVQHGSLAGRHESRSHLRARSEQASPKKTRKKRQRSPAPSSSPPGLPRVQEVLHGAKLRSVAVIHGMSKQSMGSDRVQCKTCRALRVNCKQLNLLRCVSCMELSMQDLVPFQEHLVLGRISLQRDSRI